jgi:long-chain fatty acid transport protein
MFSTKFKFSVLTAAAVAVLAPFHTAQATVGQLPLCVGTYKCGMGGAGVSIASDPTAATINPALAARMGSSAIINAGWFHADVERNISQGSPALANLAGGQQKSDASDFLNASMGVNYRVDDNLGLNISFYPGGGGATDWDDSRVGPGAGGSTLSDDRDIRWRMFNLQLAAAWAPNDTSSYGLGVILTRADMKTTALYSKVQTPTTNANPGAIDVAYGAGVQIGGVWDVYPTVSLAVDYHSRVFMERFEKYPNVFKSTVDRPATFSIGVDYDYSPETTIALDVKHIMNDGMAVMNLSADLGGFGWNNVDVIMLGVQHQMTDTLQVRAGYAFANSPIDANNIFANILFPATVEHHFTGGATYTMDAIEIGLSAYMTAKNTLTDNGSGGGYSRMGRGSWVSHQQYGSQASVKYNF